MRTSGSRCSSRIDGVASFLLLLGSLGCPTGAQAQVTITNYLWQFAYVAQSSTNAPALVARLQAEIQKVLTVGPGLGVAQYTHNDQGQSAGGEQYWIYAKPGRIDTTLCWAYPYLTPTQQTAVRAYVTADYASATYAPWQGQLAPATVQNREFFPIATRTFTSYAGFPTYPPTLEQLYGIWLCGWQFGADWSFITGGQQTSIRSWYTTVAAQGGLYGQMGGHIAKARLEHVWGNGGNEATATANLQSAMNTGLTFATVEGLVSNGATGYWRFQYLDSGKQNGQYLGWMFLGLAPEIGRYIADLNIVAALTRHAAGKAKYPLWWMRQAGYESSLAGLGSNIEGTGLSPEILGMIAPLERYTLGTSSTQLQRYASSGPVCIGDSAWLELLVYAIESTGTLQWIDVRNGHP